MVLTTELYEAVVKIVDDRIREIRVTREGFNALQQAVIQLAEAQRRTEERMGRLEVAIERLVEAQHQLGQQLGVLTDTIGFSLEDVAKVVLPSYLAKHLNVFVPELERRFFVVDKHEIEMNLYAEGWRGAESVIVLGESKSRIYKADVEKFLKSAKLIEPLLKGPAIKVMFGFYIHPSASEVAEPAGVALVASYQK